MQTCTGNEVCVRDGWWFVRYEVDVVAGLVINSGVEHRPADSDRSLIGDIIFPRFLGNSEFMIGQ